MSQKTGKRTRRHAEDSPHRVGKSETTEEKSETKEKLETKEKVLTKEKVETKQEFETKEKLEPEQKLETVVTNEETTDKDTQQCSNGMEINVQQGETHTKEVDDISIVTDSGDILHENSQSTKIEVQCENVVNKSCEENKNARIEEEESENEMEPLVVEEQSNGVQILVENAGVTENVETVIENAEKLMENPERITENVERVTEKNNKFEETEILEKKCVNGESYSDSEDRKTEDDDMDEKIDEPEADETENIDGENCYGFEDMTDTQHSEKEVSSRTLSEVSTEAVVGSDTTRLEENFEYSKFLTASKNKSFGESLRQISARRSIRTTINHFPVDGRVYHLNEIGARKRKNCEDECQDMKRAKTDSPGLMSYLGYPFKKNDVPSSTPKLTGYRANSFDNNVSKISLNDSNEKSSNKWCSVM